MFGRGKKKKVQKVSFNCPDEILEKLEEIKDVEFCNTTDVIIDALVCYIKRFDKKMARLDKINK